MKKGSADGGFSLTEILVVLVIVCMLAAVAFPTYLGYVDHVHLKQDAQTAELFTRDLAAETLVPEAPSVLPVSQAATALIQKYSRQPDIVPQTEGYFFWYDITSGEVIVAEHRPSENWYKLEVGDEVEDEEKDEGRLVIGSSNPDWPHKNSNLTHGHTQKYQDVITSVYIEDTVVVIGNQAFEEFPYLKKVEIGDSVTTLRDDVFSECGNLESVVMSDSVVRMGEDVFSDCTSLTEVILSRNLQEMGESVFEGCTSLTTIVLPDGGQFETLPEQTFKDCRNLTTVTLPESITEIGKEAFYDCRSLELSALPPGLTTIGSGAFYKCEAITSITIPETVTTIGETKKKDHGAFEGCTGLKNVTIESMDANIDERTFRGCPTDLMITVKEGSAAETFLQKHPDVYQYTVIPAETPPESRK